jgi:hypothetical protein
MWQWMLQGCWRKALQQDLQQTGQQQQQQQVVAPC